MLIDSNNSSTVQTPSPLPDNLDEYIIHHPHKERFVDTPTFVVLFLSFIAILGSIIGVILAIQS